MKKNVIIIGIVVLVVIGVLVLFLTRGKGTEETNDYNYKLIFRESSWSGWVKNYTPEEKTTEYDVVKGKEYTINDYSFKVTILDVKKDRIVIKTSQPLLGSTNGVDLNSTKTEFELYLDKELKLTTPTLDAGEIYYFTLTNK